MLATASLEVPETVWEHIQRATPAGALTVSLSGVGMAGWSKRDWQISRTAAAGLEALVESRSL